MQLFIDSFFNKYIESVIGCKAVDSMGMCSIETEKEKCTQWPVED